MTQTTGLGLENMATCSYWRDSKGHRKNKKESNRKAQGSPCCKAPDSRFIAEAFYPPFPTVSTVVVLLEATSPVAAVNSLLQCSCCHFLLFSTRWGVSISPGQNSGFVTLFFFFFSCFAPSLSFLNREVSALMGKVRLAAFLSDPFPFSFPSGASPRLFWFHNQCNYLSDDFQDFPSAQNRHLWALLLINVF